jgi:hypothetical protein
MSTKENSLYALMTMLGIGSLALVILTSIISPKYGGGDPTPTSFISILLMVVLIPIGILIVYIGNMFISGEKGPDIDTSINTQVAKSSEPFMYFIGILFSLILIVIFFCLTVHPVDGFEDKKKEQDPLVALQKRLDGLEKRTCALMKRADQFVEGDVGNAGMETDSEGNTKDTPEHRALVVEAQQKAHGLNSLNCDPPNVNEDRLTKLERLMRSCKSIPGSVLDCTFQKTPYEIIDDRIITLETTLRNFTGPVIIKSFKGTINSSTSVKPSEGCFAKPIPCYDVGRITIDDFKDGDIRNIFDLTTLFWKGKEDKSTQNAYLNFLESVIDCQEKKLLTPIDESIERLKKGNLTDCERKIMSPP